MVKVKLLKVNMKLFIKFKVKLLIVKNVNGNILCWKN